MHGRHPLDDEVSEVVTRNRVGAIDEVDPHAVEIGTPVRVVFQRLNDEIQLPRWLRC